MLTNSHTELFVRSELNPVLSAKDWPYPVHTVFNPGATRLPDGTTLLLCRCEDRRGFSHLTAARSADGLTGWVIDPVPTVLPDPANHPEEAYGIEDPRITFVEEIGRYVVAYTAFTKSGPGVALATTEDFSHFERLGLVCQPEDKDAAVFPRRFEGEFALIHRAKSSDGSHMWIASSQDLRNWGNHRTLLRARKGGWWDASKIGLAIPPVETEKGWLVLYHGVRTHASGSIYRLGLALFDLDQPETCLLRGDHWVMAPEAPYETVGDVPYVVFPCGGIVQDDGDTLRIYYGGADTCVCVAEASVRELLGWLESHGSPPVDDGHGA